MTLHVTPLPVQGKAIVRSYGEGRFRINDDIHEGGVLVFPERVVPWAVTDADGVSPESLAAVFETDTRILLVGCGERSTAPPEGLAAALSARGVVLEWMDTGAACRTFNVLQEDGRSVAAALIAVK